MATKRFENLDHDRKKSLVDSARREFAERGYEGASLAAIAEAAGVSKASLYYYFEDKADLFLTVLTCVRDEFSDQIGNPLVGEMTDDFWGDIRGYTHRIMRHFGAYPEYLAFFHVLYTIHKPMEPNDPLHELFDAARERVLSMYRHGREVGAVREDVDLELLAYIIIGMKDAFNLWFFERYRDMDEDGWIRLADEFVDMCMRIAAPANMGAGSGEKGE